MSTFPISQSEQNPYLSCLPCNEFINKGTIVLTSTAVGAGIGFGVGTACTGVGGPKGAIIGGLAGAFTGVLIIQALKSCPYKEWRQTLSENEAAEVKEKVIEVAHMEDMVCSLTREIIEFPVSLTSNPKIVYEKEALEKWVNENGTDPITRQKVTMKDYNFNLSSMIKSAKKTKELVNNPEKMLQFKPKEKIGVELLCKNYDSKAKSCLKLEFKNMENMLDAKEMGLEGVKARIQHLNREFQDS